MVMPPAPHPRFRRHSLDSTWQTWSCAWARYRSPAMAVASSSQNHSLPPGTSTTRADTKSKRSSSITTSTANLSTGTESKLMSKLPSLPSRQQPAYRDRLLGRSSPTPLWNMAWTCCPRSHHIATNTKASQTLVLLETRHENYWRATHPRRPSHPRQPLSPSYRAPPGPVVASCAARQRFQITA